MQSTADDVLAGIDLSGTRVLLTGISSGLGLETARAAATHGAERSRDGTRSRQGARGSRSPRGSRDRGCACDLASLASVRACSPTHSCLAARRIRRRHRQRRCHEQSARSHGRWVRDALRHESPRSLPADQSTPTVDRGPRTRHRSLVVRTPHRPMCRSTIPASSGRRTIHTGAYGRSKTANILFARGTRSAPRNEASARTAVHPGGDPHRRCCGIPRRSCCSRWLHRRGSQRDGTMGDPPPLKTVEQGAATTAWAAFVAPADATGGRYCEDCHVGDVADGGNVGVQALRGRPGPRGGALGR